MSLAPGELLDGKYRILAVIGHGGMGVVYVAENIRIRRQVAIKVMSREAALAGEAMLRFEREAQAAGHIGSDHIVEILDIGSTHDGTRFLVMELLDGETLKPRIKQGRMPHQKVSAIFRQLLDGLRAAHAVGIVHRDLKPENVFLQREKAGQRDWVKILDFGISKFSIVGDDGQMTKTGAVMGTPYYMSPEQIRSAHLADHRSDLYSVAVMLFEVMTGQVPFRATTYAELLFKIVYEPQPHPKALVPSLDDEICGIILKGMERDPERRFQNAEEFSAALFSWESRISAPGAQPVLPTPSVPLPTVPHAPEPISARLPSAATPSEISHPSLAAPANPDIDGAATQVWIDPQDSARNLVGTGETQKSWHEGKPAAEQEPRKGWGALIAIGALAAAAGSVGLFLAFRSPPGEPTVTPAPAAYAPPHADPPAAPAATNAPAAVQSAAPEPSASAPPAGVPALEPIAVPPPGESAARKATFKPAKPPPTRPSKRPGQAVTDYGY